MPPMPPTTGTPYIVIMPAEAMDIATTSEDIAATPESIMSVIPEAVMPAITSAPLILFGAGRHRYCDQSCNGQCLDNKSPIGVHDRSFQSGCDISDNRKVIQLMEKSRDLIPYIALFLP
jgi:hypothetical protein